jgi:serine protease Do
VRKPLPPYNETMSRRFALITLGLAAGVAFMVGLIAAGHIGPASMMAGRGIRSPERRAPALTSRALPSVVDFADVADRINPAVVNIEATSRGGGAGAVRPGSDHDQLVPDPFEDEPDHPQVPDRRDMPSRGTGSGFIIDPEGDILTNNHVVEGADRLTVKLADGQVLRARLVGADPETDIALIKVDRSGRLPVAALGRSAGLRVGEWVCAIGNPLGWDHTLTVGVVSYLGRKLFDESLDNYIQTDAAINLGNSGGPLVNTRGEVVGISAAISARASNIGFAVPIDVAIEILPQLKSRGRVSRGFLGVTVKDLDADLLRSLRLSATEGALVEDVMPRSPAERAGIEPYDIIEEVGGRKVTRGDDLIRDISTREPGSAVRLRVIRDGREQSVRVELAERQSAEQEGAPEERRSSPAGSLKGQTPAASVGLTVRELDRKLRRHLGVPAEISGVAVVRVDPFSPADDAGIERGAVVLEINRQRVRSVGDYLRAAAAARPGEALTFYLYGPGSLRTLRTIRVDGP